MVCRRACRQRSAWPGCPRVAGCVDRPEHRERCRRPLSAHATRVGSKALGRRDLHLQARLRQAESPGNQGDHRRGASWRNRASFCCARTEQNVNDAADANQRRPGQPLRRGWTTGACATAAMRAAVREVVERFGASGDVIVEFSMPGGEALAARTLNARLGIVGGLSILGTTGIVVPYSCAAWIHSIYRGIDVARASGIKHIAGSTGSTSEMAVQKLYGLSETALIDMGDFVGGMLNYAKRHPIPRITIA